MKLSFANLVIAQRYIYRISVYMSELSLVLQPFILHLVTIPSCIQIIQSFIYSLINYNRNLHNEASLFNI